MQDDTLGVIIVCCFCLALVAVRARETRSRDSGTTRYRSTPAPASTLRTLVQIPGPRAFASANEHMHSAIRTLGLRHFEFMLDSGMRSGTHFEKNIQEAEVEI
jgi:hypothetical protein